MEEVIVGAVGVLQFEVPEYRLKNEYNVDIRMQTLPYEHIRWIENEDLDPKTLDLTSDTKRIEDLKGRAAHPVHQPLVHQLGAAAQRGSAAQRIRPQPVIDFLPFPCR